MQYKTIVLELIQSHPELHERLRIGRTLLAAVEDYALALKASHDAWKRTLIRAWPGSEEGQIASEALELALEELKGFLPTGSTPGEAEDLALDGAMDFLRRHTPPG